jgi:hypothetical protein
MTTGRLGIKDLGGRIDHCHAPRRNHKRPSLALTSGGLPAVAFELSIPSFVIGDGGNFPDAPIGVVVQLGFLHAINPEIAANPKLP